MTFTEAETALLSGAKVTRKGGQYMELADTCTAEFSSRSGKLHLARPLQIFLEGVHGPRLATLTAEDLSALDWGIVP